MGYVTITRGKTTRAEGHIKTPIIVSAPHNDIKLTELVYHKRDNGFRSYALMNDYISELPFVYYIDHSKKALLLESTDDTHFKGYDFNSENENGEQSCNLTIYIPNILLVNVHEIPSVVLECHRGCASFKRERHSLF